MTEDKEPKPTCFVIQSFDDGTFDRRYRETIRPALVKANVEPQRADEILGLNPVIDKIERAIESASICVAEVSEDNPNVWLELGYALALDRPAVILCDKAYRQKLPFDVQHRPIVFYRTDSRSGFEELERNIVKYVENELKTAQRIARAPVLKPGSEGESELESYETAILSTAFSFWPSNIGGVSSWELERKISQEGFEKVAFALGVTSLISRGLLEEKLVLNQDDYEEKYYYVTKGGIEWLQSNKNLFEVKKESAFDDDIPF